MSSLSSSLLSSLLLFDALPYNAGHEPASEQSTKTSPTQTPPTHPRDNRGPTPLPSQARAARPLPSRKRRSHQLKNHEVSYQKQYFNRINGKVFFDEPVWLRTEFGNIAKSRSLVSSTTDYFNHHEEVAFAVYRSYEESPNLVKGDGIAPQPIGEAIQLVRPEMIRAMEIFLANMPLADELLRCIDPRTEIPGPYLFWFHTRKYHEKAMESLSEGHKMLIQLFQDHVQASYGKEWEHVDSQFEKERVSPLTIKYLIRPGDILVSDHFMSGSLDTYMANSWPEYDTNDMSMVRANLARPNASFKTLSKEDSIIDYSGKSPWLTWSVKSWACKYDGEFRKAPKNLVLRFHAQSLRDVVSIRCLDLYPERFAELETRYHLYKRGSTFRNFVGVLLVSYDKREDDDMIIGARRFMIDAITHNKLRRQKQELKYSPGYEAEDGTKSSPDKLELIEPSFPDQAGSPELDPSLFPRQIIAYDLRRNAWDKIEVDHIQDVQWEKAAFKNLAIEDDAKELIQALVTTHIYAQRRRRVANKGNGVIMLLYGGPGTGKTFTAESIAELVEKPLYRVACGTIGTNPEQVEKYLESQLQLGNTWDSIVLLEDADILIEKGSGRNLKCNALASAFLHVLESYRGILILTSRVEKFDEALKSRIQLSLHYNALTETQRGKIWRNCIEKLQSSDEDVLFDDLYSHIDDLKKVEMNGHQIRNTITTARRLARYRKQNLSYAHLKHVIDASGRFEPGIQTMKEGSTDEELEKGEGQ